jgi:hypothetical protein
MPEKELQNGLDLAKELETIEKSLHALKKLAKAQIDASKAIAVERRKSHPVIVERKERPNFALPSHPLMFTLIALFAGKPSRIPRKLLEKPYQQRTPQEQKEAEAFLKSMLTTDYRNDYNARGEIIQEEKRIAIICDNPKVRAKAEISDYLFSKDLNVQEETLAMYIKRTFGAEGLRHLLGLIIGLEENGRQGNFQWSLNQHLERLGYKREPNGTFKGDAKRAATEVIKILTSLLITARRKDAKGREEIIGEKIFSIDGFRVAMFQNEIIDEILTLRATEFWYRHAFEPKDKRSPMFTKLLKKIASENHRNYPLTIYLAPLLAIFWRMNPTMTLSIPHIFDWCDLDLKDNQHRMDNLRDLEKELDYMKEAGYLGDWKSNSQEHPYPSQCKDSFACSIIFTPPDWLKEEIGQIEKKRERFLPKPASQEPRVTQEQFVTAIKQSGLSIAQFAQKLSISKRMVLYIKSGKRKVTRQIDAKIRELFPAISYT